MDALRLGYLVTRLQDRLPVSAYRRPLLGTGLCGAFTTFSTMQLEVLRMLGAGRTGLAVAYALASLGQAGEVGPKHQHLAATVGLLLSPS